jgi:hypothetical protein
MVASIFQSPFSVGLFKEDSQPNGTSDRVWRRNYHFTYKISRWKRFPSDVKRKNAKSVQHQRNGPWPAFPMRQGMGMKEMNGNLFYFLE